LRSKGDLREAESAFREAIRSHPDSLEAYYDLGLALSELRNEKEAATAFQKVLQLDPGNTKAQENLSAIEKSTSPDQTVQAIPGASDLLRGPALSPGGVIASADNDNFDQIKNFEGLVQQEKWDEIQPLLRSYLAEHPYSWRVHYISGYVSFRILKIGDSIRELAKSLELNANNAEAHKVLGRDLMTIGRFDAAQTEFEQGIRYNPQSGEMHFNLGKLFSIQDNWTAARKEFEAALRIDPSYLEALDGVGLAREALGDDSGAVASYEKAIAINDARKGKFVSAHVNLSAHYNQKSDPKKALQYARAALQVDPKSDSAWFQQAKANEAQGQLYDAVNALNRAIALNPHTSSYYYVLARVCRRLGKLDEARKALDSFARLEKETNDLEEMRRNLANRPGNPSERRSQRD
jgi:tetratricopeptide (TPR) repeat protein